MTDVMVEAVDVIKDFKISRGLFRGKETLRAVDKVSLKIKRGETVAIVGESGCGKTTFAKVILGLLNQDGGTVKLCNQLIGEIPRLDLAKLCSLFFKTHIHRLIHEKRSAQ